MSETEQEHVDIELLMLQIRRQIMAQRAAAGDEAATRVPVAGRRFPPDFYDHLYLAGLAYNDLAVDAVVQKSKLPLVGPLLTRLRLALHQLVLFYVNRVAERQAAINGHLLQALSILSEELDRELSDGEPA